MNLGGAVRLSLLILFGAVPCVAVGATQEKPNIVFVLADDLGNGDVSSYGSDNYRTPNLDELARDGIRFTNAYTAPLCGPSRALMLTGRYAFRTGATNQDNVQRITPSDETIIPEVLKSAGYATSLVGKWSQFKTNPNEFGFDDYLTIKGSGAYWNTQKNKGYYFSNGEKLELLDDEYMPDVMHRHLVEFIDAHREQPFFVFYSMSHPHADFLPTPDSTPDSKDLRADNIAYMDKLVGKLIDALDRLDLRDETLVVFMGDNGTGTKLARRATIGGRRLAGGKGTMREGGALVPLIVNWPGTTPSGEVSSQLIDSADLLPTFAELTGAELPDTVLDGLSFAHALTGRPGTERDWIFVQLAGMWYVRDALWKLNQAGELFDMSDAPFREVLIAPGSEDEAATAARNRLQSTLDRLNPAGGILDDGDGTGRHVKKNKKKKKGQ